VCGPLFPGCHFDSYNLVVLANGSLVGFAAQASQEQLWDPCLLTRVREAETDSGFSV